MSLLEGILSRLKHMQESGINQERLFEQDGIKKCNVRYIADGNTFEVKIFQKDGKNNSFSFDNMDMAAIEIFDLLQNE